MKTIIYCLNIFLYVLLNMLPFMVAYKHDLLLIILLSPLVALYAEYTFNDISKSWNL